MRNASASIFTVGWRWTKFEIGPAPTIITPDGDHDGDDHDGDVLGHPDGP